MCFGSETYTYWSALAVKAGLTIRPATGVEAAAALIFVAAAFHDTAVIRALVMIIDVVTLGAVASSLLQARHISVGSRASETKSRQSND